MCVDSMIGVYYYTPSRCEAHIAIQIHPTYIHYYYDM
jgi:hypothetical protein